MGDIRASKPTGSTPNKVTQSYQTHPGETKAPEASGASKITTHDVPDLQQQARIITQGTPIVTGSAWSTRTCLIYKYWRLNKMYTLRQLDFM